MQGSHWRLAKQCLVRTKPARVRSDARGFAATPCAEGFFAAILPREFWHHVCIEALAYSNLTEPTINHAGLRGNLGHTTRAASVGRIMRILLIEDSEELSGLLAQGLSRAGFESDI